MHWKRRLADDVRFGAKLPRHAIGDLLGIGHAIRTDFYDFARDHVTNRIVAINQVEAAQR